jgi:transposase
MARRVFGREFKVEAVRLMRERGVSAAQASRDIDVLDARLDSGGWAIRRCGHQPVLAMGRRLVDEG